MPRGSPCARDVGRLPPPPASVSPLRSPVNTSKLRATILPYTAPRAVPGLAGKFPQQPTIPSGYEPSASLRNSGQPGLQRTTHRSSSLPCSSADKLCRRPRAQQMGDFPDPSSFPSPALPCPPLPRRTHGIKPSPSANYTRPRRPSLAVQLHGRPGAGVGGAAATRAARRGVPTPDFI